MRTVLSHLSRRQTVRLVSYALALVVALTGGAIASSVTASKYRTQLEYTYERGLSELSEHLNTIETTLTKGIYTGTPAGALNLAMNLWSNSGSAKACLSQIPTYGSDLENTYKFLSQVGEYSLALAKKMQAGGTITKEEHQQLVTLSSHAKELSAMVQELCSQMSRDGQWKAQIANVVEQQDPDTAADTLYTSLNNMEESLTDYPSLLYDGPFSEHILQSKPLLLQSKPAVKEPDARAKAAKAMGVSVEAISDATAWEENAIPCYVYYSQNATAAITRQGGYVNYFQNYRDIGEESLQYDQCVAKAKEYLDSLDIGRFQESYYTISEGVCLINFAYVQEDVVCYPDLIKIGVALDDGEIVSFNAQGYVMNHTPRALGRPDHTLEEAREVLSPYLTVKSSQKAVIPMDTRDTALCYEFLCQGSQGEEILVYVNADTLAEEQLLILLKTDGGTLTI